MFRESPDQPAEELVEEPEFPPAEETVEDPVMPEPQPQQVDSTLWARAGGEKSWHEVQEERPGGVLTWCDRVLISPDRREDLGSQKSCENCYRRKMHRGDL